MSVHLTKEYKYISKENKRECSGTVSIVCYDGGRIHVSKSQGHDGVEGMEAIIALHDLLGEFLSGKK